MSESAQLAHLKAAILSILGFTVPESRQKAKKAELADYLDQIHELATRVLDEAELLCESSSMAAEFSSNNCCPPYHDSSPATLPTRTASPEACSSGSESHCSPKSNRLSSSKAGAAPETTEFAGRQ